MTNTVPIARKNRGGTGVLPPNPAWWECEHNGLDLRIELAAATENPLDIADAFARVPGAVVIPHGNLAAAHIHLQHFRGEGSGRWSGMALRLDDGTDLIVYNDSHSRTRIRATLMEEYFHLKLNHERSRVRLLSDGAKQRTYNSEIEKNAYGSGAAALLPYCALKALVLGGVRTSEIARQFEVSEDLVRYRMKITRLFRKRR